MCRRAVWVTDVLFSWFFAQKIFDIVPRGFSHAPPCAAPHMPMKKPGWPVTAFLSGMAGRVLFVREVRHRNSVCPCRTPSVLRPLLRVRES